MNLLKNRTLIGAVSIIISLIICFAVTPLVNRGLSKKVPVLRFVRSVEAGEKVTKDMVEEVEVGAYNLSAGVIQDISGAEGKYLTAKVFKGDYLFPEKLSDEPEAENRYLYRLDGKRQAVSITLDSFAEGLSGKLRSGDIISVIAPDYLNSGEAVIPPELTYMEVIAATAKSGYDAEQGKETDEERELPSTVTLLATPVQAKLLAALEADGHMHLALVYRGDEKTSAAFLEEQEKVLLKLAEEASETEEENAEEET